jgi:hypothetical protein
VTQQHLQRIFPILDLLLCTQSAPIRKKALMLMLGYFTGSLKTLEEYKEIYKVLPFSRLVISGQLDHPKLQRSEQLPEVEGWLKTTEPEV